MEAVRTDEMEVYMLRRFCLSMFLLCLVLCTTSAAAFSDTGNSWAADVVEKAAAYGLMEGSPDGTFGVGRDITRGEFVTILCRFFQWETVRPETPSYADCLPEEWYYPYVETARAHNVMEPDGAFRPTEPISREELAVMLVRALGYDTLAQSLGELSLPFDDVTGHIGHIAIAYDTGMITGVAEPDGALYFYPSGSAKREEAAAMLVRVYERYTSKTDWLHAFYAFSSYNQINLTPYMDGVSVGWARLEFDPQTGPRMNSTAENGNDWVKPADPTPATQYFQEHSIPCQLNVYATAEDKLTLPDGSTTSTIAALLSPEHRSTSVTLLVEAAREYAGLTLDFEGLRRDLKESFAQFVQELREALPPEQRLYVCVQPDTWYDGFDYRSLGESCDKVILMAHDYQWPASEVPKYTGTANTDSPVTPIVWVYRALRSITDPETGVADRSKLALAIAFNTAGFHVDENGVLLDGTMYHPSRDVLTKRLQQESTVVTYSERYRNPVASYTTEDGERYRVWYEDSQSVQDKLQLARMFGIQGVSLWRLGIIPASTGYDVWSGIVNTLD